MLKLHKIMAEGGGNYDHGQWIIIIGCIILDPWTKVKGQSAPLDQRFIVIRKKVQFKVRFY